MRDLPKHPRLSISDGEPFALSVGAHAASRSDFEDRRGWSIQLFCPDDKIGAT